MCLFAAAVVGTLLWLLLLLFLPVVVADAAVALTLLWLLQLLLLL